MRGYCKRQSYYIEKQKTYGLKQDPIPKPSFNLWLKDYIYIYINKNDEIITFKNF